MLNMSATERSMCTAKLAAARFKPCKKGCTRQKIRVRTPACTQHAYQLAVTVQVTARYTESIQQPSARSHTHTKGQEAALASGYQSATSHLL